MEVVHSWEISIIMHISLALDYNALDPVYYEAAAKS